MDKKKKKKKKTKMKKKEKAKSHSRTKSKVIKKTVGMLSISQNHHSPLHDGTFVSTFVGPRTPFNVTQDPSLPVHDCPFVSALVVPRASSSLRIGINAVEFSFAGRFQ